MSKIINILKEKKSIPLDQFINIALYDKKFGYYMKKNPFGKKGDFITSPLVTNLFGEMIAVWCVSFWESLGKPRKFVIVELGPGDGSLCKDIITASKNFVDFYNCLEIKLLENRGYSTNEMRAKMHRSFAYPLFLLGMILLSGVFTLGMTFKESNWTYVFIALITSVLIFYFNDFSTALGKTGKLPVEVSVWIPVLVILIFSSVGLIHANQK